jgi:transcription elongation factor GreA
MADEIILTPSGKQKIEEELEQLRSVEMPALSERIRQARELGDLSENFDYQDAKRQQGFVAGKIVELQAFLERAKVVEEVDHSTGIAGLGSAVTVRDLEYDDETVYTLVGAYEANPLEDKISVSSPLGKALLGVQVGDKVEFETPGGLNHIEVLAVA